MDLNSVDLNELMNAKEYVDRPLTKNDIPERGVNQEFYQKVIDFLAPDLSPQMTTFAFDCIKQPNFYGLPFIPYLPLEVRRARDLVISNDDVPQCVEKFEVYSQLFLVEELLRSLKPVMNVVKPKRIDIKPTDRAKHQFYIYYTFENKAVKGHLRANDLRYGVDVILCTRKELHTSKPKTSRGIVTKINKTMVQICCKTYDRDVDDIGDYFVYIRPNYIIYSGFQCVIKDLIYNKEVYTKVYFPLPETLPTSFSAPLPPPSDIPFFNSKLNEEQKLCIDRILNMSPERAFVLFGPPGTGKTTTLVETVNQLVVNHNANVLVCTPSNMAGDSFALTLVRSKVIPMSMIIRATAASVDYDARNQELDAITLSDGGKYKTEEIDFRDYSVVISTIGSLQRLTDGKKKVYFTHIIIDEAGQASEPESLIPLANFGSLDTRFVLAGDPKQLGPVVTHAVIEPMFSQYDKSLLRRLSERADYIADDKLMIQLVANHRSHECIVESASAMFYNNTLVATNPPGHDCFEQYAQDRGSLMPFLFHAVDGIEEKVGCSYSNKAEADVIYRLVDELLSMKGTGLRPSDIGVISPYTAQSSLIQGMLKRHSGMTISTVEKFQGSERRVIIMTTVRTSDLGFLRSPHRLNTAITRARQLLIMVGRPQTLMADELYAVLLQYVIKYNGFFPSEKCIDFEGALNQVMDGFRRQAQISSN